MDIFKIASSITLGTKICAVIMIFLFYEKCLFEEVVDICTSNLEKHADNGKASKKVEI